MTIGINTSPLAGREGKKLTARLVKNRLDAELIGNVSIRVNPTERPDAWEVQARGELMNRTNYSRRSGVIVNISSVGGRMAYPLGSLYHGSKWAVEGISEAVHFELSMLGIRVKIVEPGGVNTDFGGRSFVFSHDPEFPDYQPLVDMFTAALEEEAYDDNQEPNEVAEVIFNAATDGSDQLRYISGDGAAQLLANRYSAEQDEQFVAGMRAQFGL